MNAGILLAGGFGERMFGVNIPKQFIEVSGNPLIMYSLMAVQKCVDISTITIAAAPEWQERIVKWVNHYKISKFNRFASPGQTRQQSVYNCLLVLRDMLQDDDRVIIHDAARPLVTPEDIHNCIVSAAGYDGATPVLKITDAIYKSTDGITISNLINRNEVFAGQTPECYNFGKYFLAHQRLPAAEIENIRGSSEIAFKAGMNVRLFPGNPNSFKITTTADLEYLKYKKESANESMDIT